MKISKDRIKEIIREEILNEFHGLPSRGKVFIRVKDKAEAEKYLKRMGIKFTEAEKEVHGFTWWDKNKTVAELNKNLLILYEATKVQQNRLNEALDKKDYMEIKDIIRAEIAAVFFDLFKKKSMWL
jgi:hypothetical protein